MPRYKYVGKVDFIEPSLEQWIIKPNQIIELKRDLPRHLLDSGLFVKLDDNPAPITDRDIEVDLAVGETKEVEIDNAHYNNVQIFVLPKDKSLTQPITKRQIVYVYQNHENEENKLIVELGGSTTIYNIKSSSYAGKNIFKLIFKSDDENEIDLTVRLHLYNFLP